MALRLSTKYTEVGSAISRNIDDTIQKEDK